MKFSQLTYFGAQIIRMHLQPSYRVPLSMHIVLTNRCNLKCEYCRTHDLPQTDVWTTESLKNVITEMRDCGTKRIHFTGGEPLMRKDLGELITHAKNLGLFVSFVSNGALVTKRLDEIKDVDVVFLSYDGTPEIHGRIRGERNAQEVESAIIALKAAGIDVWTTTVLTRLNAGHLDKIVDFARKHNITANFNRLEYFAEPPYHLHPMMKEIEDLILKRDERKKVFRKLLEFKKSGAPIGSSAEYLRNGMDWLYDDKVFSPEPSRQYSCWAGRAQAHLEADGRVYSCGTEVGVTEGVSVLDQGFRSAWEKLPRKENCKSCSHACMVEGNLIFSLNPSTVLNWVKVTMSQK